MFATVETTRLSRWKKIRKIHTSGLLNTIKIYIRISQHQRCIEGEFVAMKDRYKCAESADGVT